MGSRKLISAAVVEASDASLSSGLYSWPPLNKSRATETMQQQQFKLKRATQSYTPSLPYIWLARTNKTNFKSWCSCNHANPCSTKSDISARVQLHRSMTYQGSLWTSVRPSHLKDSLIRQRPLMLIIWWGNGSSPDDENYELVFDRWPRQLYCKVIITIFLEEGHLLSCWKNEKQCLSIWRYYRASSP